MNQQVQNSLMLRALRREPVDRLPVWLMRQAGRYMPEYRAVREKYSFLDLCHRPSLCAEVMRVTVEKLGVDAAIIFSDLLLILDPIGFPFEYSSTDGPFLRQPFRSRLDLNHVKELEDLSSLDYVFRTVEKTRKVIDSSKPVIGFAGAPFTLASYMIEGRSSRTFSLTKQFMYTEPEAWHELLARLARSTARYLNEQIRAGADVVQIFDSWIGILGPTDYRRFVLPHSRELIAQITPGTPVIHFGTGNPELLPLFSQAGGDAIGVDWRIPIDRAWERIGPDRALQGNLDPSVLLADHKMIRSEVRRIKRLVGDRPGFIFNLGHGILKETPEENVRFLVQEVHEESVEL